MKLATYQDGSRDGQLVVVSRDLSTAHYAAGIVNHLQQALDDWNFVSPQLQDLYETINQGKARHAFPFDPQRCAAPLPRAYQWAQGNAFTGLAQPLQPEPALQIEPSDAFWGPCEDIAADSKSVEIDFAASLAVITGDVPRGADAEQALEGIRLFLLANTLTAHPHRHPSLATAFSPVAVTLDELEAAWQNGRVHLTLQTHWNGRKVGLCDTGSDMRLHFGQLIAHLCARRPVRAGSVVGSGPVCSPGVADAKGRLQWPKGYHSIAEKRAIEALQDGQASTGFMQFDDTVRIDMKDLQGQSLLGAIESCLVPTQR